MHLQQTFNTFIFITLPKQQINLAISNNFFVNIQQKKAIVIKLTNLYVWVQTKKPHQK